MNAHALSALEYGRVREAVLERVVSAAGWRAAEGWGPAGDPDRVRALVEETAQMRAFLGEEGPLDFSGLTPPEELLRRARPAGACLSQAEVHSVWRLCLLARKARSRLKPAAGCPRLAALAGALPLLGRLEKEIGGVLDEEGEFREGASPAFRRIRRAQAASRDALLDLLRGLLGSRPADGLFQDDIIATRGGRYVLVVKAQARGRIQGVVHDRTASGAGLYLEPQEAVGPNNRLVELAREEEEEKRRLLTGLTARIGEETPALEAAASLLGGLDLIQARALHGLAAPHVHPEFNEEGRLALRRARHPVLEKVMGDRLVPLDLEVGGEVRALLVTGPNTGGKTVALKTAGLLALMAQSGLFLPAEEGTTLPVFSDIFADIGDEQSIEQNLSTFSAHLRNIAEAAREAGDRSLVVLDELGAGTDPAEGAPLAMAIVEHLLDRGALTLASTHQGSLVAFAASTPLAANASMEFDPGTLKPTFRLVMGIPGRSNAREIARQTGLPGKIIDRSLQLAPQAERGVAGLVEDLSERRRRLAEEERHLGERQAELDRTLAETRRELEGIRAERERTAGAAREEARQLLDRARAELREILAAARASGGGGHQRLSAVAGELREGLPSPGRKPGRPLEELPPVGTTARLAGSAASGKVLEVDPETRVVTLEVGGKKVRVPLESLERAGEEATAAPRGGYGLESGEVQESRLDLRGLREEAAVAELVPFLDRAWLAGLERVEILHGKGLGRLKDACARVLEGHPGIAEYGPAPDERGGAGVTVARFK